MHVKSNKLDLFFSVAISTYVSLIVNVGDGIPSDCRRVSICENDRPISLAAYASCSKSVLNTHLGYLFIRIGRTCFMGLGYAFLLCF